MKKLMLILVIVIFASCASPVDEPDTTVPFSFDGHWNLYNFLGNYAGGDCYFEGDQYWLLKDDKMTAGAHFTYTDTEFTSYRSDGTIRGTQRYDIIDNDTVYFYPTNGNGMSWFWDYTFKRSGRTGRILPVNGSYTFVDD